VEHITNEREQKIPGLCFCILERGLVLLLLGFSTRHGSCTDFVSQFQIEIGYKVRELSKEIRCLIRELSQHRVQYWVP
jgi:hypothetical protein